MKIPHYWARARHEGTDKKGHAWTFVASGWSFTSLEEARSEASTRAKRIFELITSGQKPVRYTNRDAQYKVCELLREFGIPADIDSLRTIVDVHDQGTRIFADAELA